MFSLHFFRLFSKLIEATFLAGHAADTFRSGMWRRWPVGDTTIRQVYAKKKYRKICGNKNAKESENCISLSFH
jgi:hypothetical protein